MGTAYNPSMVTNGLQICYDAGNTKSYTGSGTTWTNAITYTNNGTLTNSPGYTASFGGGIVFDGTNDFVVVPDNAVDANADFTMSFWIRGISTGTRTMYGVQNTSNNTGRFQLRYAGVPISLQVLRNGVALVASWTPSVTINENQYVTVKLTKSTNTWEAYVNAVSLGATAATAATFTNTTMAIGSARTFDGELFLGNIYAFHHYNRVLTDAEIQQNFNATRSRYGV